MVVSLVLHAVLILFVAHHLRIAAPEFEPLAPVARPLEGLRAIRFRQVETKPQVTFIEPPSLEEELLLVDRVGKRTRPVPVRGDEDVRGFTNAEKLTPREGDWSGWKNFSGQPLPYYEGDPYAPGEGAVLAGLSQMLDSLEFSEKQRRRAIGWFAGEGYDGVGLALEWIVCGEQLITLNLGTVCADEGPLSREVLQAARALAEIQQSDIHMDAKAVRRERSNGMRRRTREELTRRNSSVDGGP